VIAFGQVLTNLCYLVGIYIALIRLNAFYGLASLVLIPIFLVWALFYQKYANVYTVKIRELIGDINAKINESIQGMPIIQSFQQEKKIEEEFKEVNDEWYKYSQKFILLDSVAAWSFVGSLRNFALLLLILYVGMGTIGGSIGITVCFLYLLVVFSI